MRTTYVHVGVVFQRLLGRLTVGPHWQASVLRDETLQVLRGQSGLSCMGPTKYSVLFYTGANLQNQPIQGLSWRGKAPFILR